MPPNEELPHRKQKRKKGADDTFSEVNLKKDKIEEDDGNLYVHPCDASKEKINKDDNNSIAQSENKKTKPSTNKEKETTSNLSTTNENKEKNSTANENETEPEMDDAASDILENESETAEHNVSCDSESKETTYDNESEKNFNSKNIDIFNSSSFSENQFEMSGSDNKVENLTAEQKQKKREELIKRFTVLEDFKKEMEEKVKYYNRQFASYDRDYKFLKDDNQEMANQNLKLQSTISEQKHLVSQYAIENSELKEKVDKLESEVRKLIELVKRMPSTTNQQQDQSQEFKDHWISKTSGRKRNIRYRIEQEDWFLNPLHQPCGERQLKTSKS